MLVNDYVEGWMDGWLIYNKVVSVISTGVNIVTI
jgi:hypothetical protein